ncbi:MAG: hypothetical protein ABIA76_00750 [Candidatus Diapherotrites archaeon]
MFECEAKLKTWGNSIGVVLPKKELEKENLSADSKVRVVVFPAKKLTVGDIFGKLENWKKPASRIMKEIDEELDSKFFK